MNEGMSFWGEISEAAEEGTHCTVLHSTGVSARLGSKRCYLAVSAYKTFQTLSPGICFKSLWVSHEALARRNLEHLLGDHRGRHKVLEHTDRISAGQGHSLSSMYLYGRIHLFSFLLLSCTFKTHLHSNKGAFSPSFTPSSGNWGCSLSEYTSNSMTHPCSKADWSQKFKWG